MKASRDGVRIGDIEEPSALALLEPERLIEEKSTKKDVSAAVQAEAQELFRLGRELYLEREYELALEMVEEAIAMLKEREGCPGWRSRKYCLFTKA